jgi:hypothetical protein
MPILSPAITTVIGLVVAPGIFLLSALLTRASLRRAAGGLAGGLGFLLLNISVDQLAKDAGWWSYPAYSSSGSLPLIYYGLSGMVFAAFTLVGWRIARQYSWRGIASFILVWGLWGVIHDVGGSTLFAGSQLMQFGPGFIPPVADFCLYAAGMGLALVILRWLGGPFQAV